MKSRSPQIFIRAGIAAAIAAIAAPVCAQPSNPGGTLPYEAAKARVKEAKEKSIYFGQETPKGAFPFVVGLIQADAENSEEGNYNGQYCGGSLIADRWVVTAGQCAVAEDDDGKKVALKPDRVEVYVGSTNFKDGKRIKVKRVILHAQFDSDTFNNDIALLELEQSAASDKVKPVSPATPQNEAAIAGVGKKVVAAGWGETEEKEMPQAMRHVEMDVLDSKMCNDNIIKYRMTTTLMSWARTAQVQFALADGVVEQVRSLVQQNAGRLVTDNMICSGRLRTQRDTCTGDSGGPLFGKAADGKFALVGLTSWGEGCGAGDKGLFGIYTRVSRYSSWIQDNAK